MKVSYLFSVLGRLKKEARAQNKPKTPKPYRPKTTRRPYVNQKESPEACKRRNKQSGNGKGWKCWKWGRTICVAGKDSGRKECGGGGGGESGRGGLRAAAGVILVIHLLLHF